MANRISSWVLIAATNLRRLYSRAWADAPDAFITRPVDLKDECMSGFLFRSHARMHDTLWTSRGGALVGARGSFEQMHKWLPPFLACTNTWHAVGALCPLSLVLFFWGKLRELLLNLWNLTNSFFPSLYFSFILHAVFLNCRKQCLAQKIIIFIQMIVWVI